MATTETINILKIDGSSAITTLRELKAAIDSDKDALVALGVVEDSDTKKKQQQAKIIAKLDAELKLLNQVQAAGKVTTLEAAKAANTVTDSYYSLQKSLTTLKKAWKDMSAEERASAEGTEILNKIKQIDVQLKTLDSSIGQYQRNVGNYGQTFKESLDQAQKGAMGLMQGFSSLNSLLAMGGEKADGFMKVMAGVQTAFLVLNGAKGLTDFIKKGKEAIATITGATKATQAETVATNTQTGAMAGEAAATNTATLATKAFKEALISTGIGAIIVAVATLAAHFEDLTDALGITDKKMKDTFDTIKRGLEKANDSLKQQIRLYEAGGAVKEEVMSKEITLIGELVDKYDEYRTKVIEAYGANTSAAQDAHDLYKEEAKALKDALNSAQVALVGFISSAETTKAQQGMSEYAKSIDNVQRRVKALRQTIDQLWDAGMITSVAKYREYIRRLADAGQTEITEINKRAGKQRQNQELTYWKTMVSITKTGTEENRIAVETAARLEYAMRVREAKETITNRQLLYQTLEALEKQYQQTSLQNEQAFQDEKANARVLALQNAANQEAKGTKEYYAKMQAVREEEYASIVRREGETDDELLARRMAAYDNILKAQEDYDRAALAEQTNAIKAQMVTLKEGSIEQLTLAAELARTEMEGIYQQVGETDEAFRVRQLEAEKKYYDSLAAINDAEIEQGRQALAGRLAVLEQGSAEYLEAALELKKYELDTLHQMQDESEDAFNQRRLEAEKAYLDAKKALNENYQKGIQQGIAATSSLFDSIAGIYEANGKEDKKAAKRAKNLRIASATIDMYQGATTAYTSAQSLGPIMGPIVGAINAAAVLATGMANIAKIRSTDTSGEATSGSGGSASAPAVVQAPTVQPTITEVRTLTGASEEDKLNAQNEPQRVYILESDIEAAANASRARVAETTF